MPNKETAVKHSTILTAYLLVVWGLYRLIFKLPDDVEDLIIKPVLWLVPVYFLVRKEKLSFSSLGLSSKNLFPTIYSVLALGVFLTIMGVIMNIMKYGNINFSSTISTTPFLSLLLLTFVTGVTEEIAFRGYIFNRIWFALGNEWKANILVSIAWTLIHIPIALVWWKVDMFGLLGILVITFIFGLGSSFVFARTKNIIGPILLHMLWEWPIILFR